LSEITVPWYRIPIDPIPSRSTFDRGFSVTGAGADAIVCRFIDAAAIVADDAVRKVLLEGRFFGKGGFPEFLAPV
jgi:hypothetical protein